jgi:hypothetical protein
MELEKRARRPVSRVLSASEGAGRPFLWDAPHGAPRATYPESGAGTPVAFSACSPYSVLLPVGFTVPSALPQTRCALTAPFHPYPRPDRARAVCFLWHFPSGCPGRPLTGTVFPWSPDFPLLAGASSGRPTVWREWGWDGAGGGSRGVYKTGVSAVQQTYKTRFCAVQKTYRTRVIHR